jgi:hypothetical protein
VNLDSPPSPGPAGAATLPEAGMGQDPGPTVSGRPTLRDPRGDDRLIEELADLVAAALVAALQRQKNDTDSHALSEAMVVSPPGNHHRKGLRTKESGPNDPMTTGGSQDTEAGIGHDKCERIEP